MTEPTKAIFLSYASQNADAARRIGEALRQAGLEVWFDQSELRGGDAWDEMIRRQIAECALFIPIISTSTASRLEGYFRLEWTLADQRTQRMARTKTFIVPVCIDATPESGSTRAQPPECREIRRVLRTCGDARNFRSHFTARHAAAGVAATSDHCTGAGRGSACSRLQQSPSPLCSVWPMSECGRRRLRSPVCRSH
jgi:hypothetical protein